jgi:hypothetical protein
LIRGVYLVDHQQFGFKHDHLLMAALVLDRTRYVDSTKQSQFVRSLVAKLRQIPGAANRRLWSRICRLLDRRLSTRSSRACYSSASRYLSTSFRGNALRRLLRNLGVRRDAPHDLIQRSHPETSSKLARCTRSRGLPIKVSRNFRSTHIGSGRPRLHTRVFAEALVASRFSNVDFRAMRSPFELTKSLKV